MSAKFLFFAECADWMGCREMEIFFPKPMKLSEFLENTPAFFPLLSHLDLLKVAVNQSLSDFHKMVCDGDEIAFMPPYSGG